MKMAKEAVWAVYRLVDGRRVLVDRISCLFGATTAMFETYRAHPDLDPLEPLICEQETDGRLLVDA